MILETERLILRRYKELDLQDLYEYLSDPDVVKFEPYKPMTLDEVRDNLAWRVSTDEMIAIELKDTGKMIGNVYLGKRDFDTLEIGYVLNKKYWGHGYAVESCKVLIDKAFENGIHRIFAECDPMNMNSWQLLERLGFRRETYFQKTLPFGRTKMDNPFGKIPMFTPCCKEKIINEHRNEYFDTRTISGLIHIRRLGATM